jgi:ABC-type uncharacterized transport system substrate-binding protein
MDTKRNTSQAWMTEISEKAIKEINEFKPDVLMVFDDNACRYVAEQFKDSDLKIVFCGMNGDPEDYGFPADNITGVLERELWSESFELVKELKPSVKNAVILLDSSATSAQTARRIESSSLMNELMAVYRISTFDAWKNTVIQCQDSAEALGLFVYFALKDSSGNTVPADEVLKWTLENNKLPEFAILDFTVENGALCGVIETGHTQGKLAAQLALKILDGKDPADLNILSPNKGERLINKNRAAQLEIDLSKEVKRNARIIP